MSVTHHPTVTDDPLSDFMAPVRMTRLEKHTLREDLKSHTAAYLEAGHSVVVVNSGEPTRRANPAASVDFIDLD